MSKILFTTAPFIVDERENLSSSGHTALSFAVYYLTTIMQKHRHEVTIVDPVHFEEQVRTVTADPAEIKQYDYICISVNSFNWWKTKEFLEQLEKMEAAPPVILGGIHASVLYEHILKMYRMPLYVVVGEGERALPELVEALENGESAANVPGAAYRDGDAVIAVPPRKGNIREDFEENIEVDYSQLPEGVYRYFPVASSIGCPYNCAFCSIWHKNSYHPVKRELFFKQLDHVKQYSNKLVDNQLRVMIVDDNFTTNKNRLYDLVGEMVEHYNDYHYFIESRASDLQHRRVPAVLSNLNNVKIQIGVECGYDEGLEKIKKKTTVAQVDEAFENLSQYGMTYHSFQTYIIGFPWEGQAECKKTIDYAINKIKRYPTQVFLNWLFILPNSEIYNRAEIDNLAAVYDIPRWYQDMAVYLKTHKLDKDDYREVLDYSEAYVKQNPNLYFSNLSIV